MWKFCVLVTVLAAACCASASWYWPFGSDTAEAKVPPRLAALMEPATRLIDEASDFAAEGKTSEAIAKYREALGQIELIEMENPERAKSAEFATLRNKRAYVNAAVDALLLSQVRENARAVAVSDTTALEERLSRERWQKHADSARNALGGGDGERGAKFLAEIAAADAVTTNAVLRAALHGLEAAACFKKGDGKGACRALDRFREGLGKEGDFSEADLAAAKGGLRDIRALAIEWCDAAVAFGEVARAACRRLADLQRTNEVARAVRGPLESLRCTNDVEVSVLAVRTEIDANLVRQRGYLEAYPFEQAVQLTNETVGVLRQLDGLTGPELDLTNYEAAMADYKALVSAFGGVRRRIEGIERRLANETDTAAPEAEKAKAAPVAPVVRPAVDEAKASEPKTGTARTLAAPASAGRATSPARSKREQAMVDIANGDFAAADILIREMLEAKPNNALALNLKATMEARQGKLKEAEDTLDQAMRSNPRSHYAYYNMAILTLQKNPDAKAVARRYYETGRTYGGPQDPQLEAVFK